ncbi:hypothetical protein J7K74_00340 [Candidatus Woesearchaeota archaeon]|nr:hypothetical protein [Candidatus Woesearchaeota archaeon]
MSIDDRIKTIIDELRFGLPSTALGIIGIYKSIDMFRKGTLLETRWMPYIIAAISVVPTFIGGSLLYDAARRIYTTIKYKKRARNIQEEIEKYEELYAKDE